MTFSIFGWKLIKSKASGRNGNLFTDEDRENAQEMRRRKAEISKMKQEVEMLREQKRLEEMRADYEDMLMDLQGDDEEQNPISSPEAMLIPLLMRAFNPQTPQQEPVITAASVSKIHYTDEEIKQLLKQVPKKALKIARSMDNATIQKFILAQQPNVDEDSIQRAIKLIKA